jgi:hypothetical protein
VFCDHLLLHADENTEHHIEWENKDLPNRLQDINDYQYPLFITDRQLLLMLDASLEPPYYFDRNIDFSPKVEVEGWTNLDILQNILSRFGKSLFSHSIWCSVFSSACINSRNVFWTSPHNTLFFVIKI